MSDRRRAIDRSVSDAGFTLTELLVYLMLAVVVLTVVGGILINSLTVERSVSDTSQASNDGQLVSSAVGRGVRNASVVWHSAVGADPELLMVRTSGSETPQKWTCQAWSYSDGEIRMRSSTAAISTTVTPLALKSWTLLADGVRPTYVGSVASPIFALSGPGPGLPFNRVDLQLTVNAGESRPVLIDTSSVRRQPAGVLGASPVCFP